MAKVTVGNVNQPGHAGQVDADRCHAVAGATLQRLSHGPMTAAAIKAVALRHTPIAFAGRVLAGSSGKCAQLDHTIKGVIVRHARTPLMWAATT